MRLSILIWRITEIEEGVTASTDKTLLDLHNSSYDTKAEFNNCCRSIDVKFIFDSERFGLFSSANILQIADDALRVVFLQFLPCFQPFFRLVLTLERSTLVSWSLIWKLNLLYILFYFINGHIHYIFALNLRCTKRLVLKMYMDRLNLESIQNQQ